MHFMHIHNEFFFFGEAKFAVVITRSTVTKLRLDSLDSYEQSHRDKGGGISPILHPDRNYGESTCQHQTGMRQA